MRRRGRHGGSGWRAGLARRDLQADAGDASFEALAHEPGRIVQQEAERIRVRLERHDSRHP